MPRFRSQKVRSVDKLLEQFWILMISLRMEIAREI